jgi:hypothetical protein
MKSFLIISCPVRENKSCVAMYMYNAEIVRSLVAKHILGMKEVPNQQYF